MAPEELGGEHPTSRLGDPSQLGRGAVTVDEHRDGLGDYHVEGVVGVLEVEDVTVLDGDEVRQVGGGRDVRFGALQHQRRDVDGGHASPVVLGDLDCGGGDAAARVEHAALRMTCARASNSSVDARPPGWITRLPITAMNLYGSSFAISSATGFVIGHPRLRVLSHLRAER